MVAMRWVRALGVRALGVRALGALLLTALWVGPLAAQGDYVEAYKAGLAALEARNWTATAASMRQAIAARPEEDARVLRLGFGRYLPHYYLGRALFELGDCPGALEAWGESERQGIIQRLPQFEELEADRARCQNRLAAQKRAGEAVRAAEGALRQAEEALAKAGEVGRNPEMTEAWGQGNPSPARRLADAESRLGGARDRLDEARRAGDGASAETERVAREVQALAAEITTAATALRREGEEILAADQSRRETLVRNLNPLLDDARALLREIRGLAPYPPEIDRLRSRLQGLVASGEAQQGGAAGSPAQIARLRENLEEVLGSLREASAPPPEILRQASEAFLRGAHEEVLARIADDASLPRGRARAHALLLRAASRHALYLRGGEADPELLASARADVLACHGADPGLSPTPRAFSPRFRDFFKAETTPPPPSP